jgi:peptidoglycan/xylan/chitin deacetylase (PgdA/CDA1 family)
VPPLHKLAVVLIVGAVVAGFLAPKATAPPTEGAARVAATPAGRVTAAGPAATPKTAKPTATIGVASATARQVKANELGQIPVIMYHRIADKPSSSLDRTPGQFRAELNRLAKEGYVPITAAEFVRGWINVPAGRHPVVLTFDDGTAGHFALDAQGAPKPGTAVGIMLEVARKHPGFRPVATFYVNAEPFQLGAGAGAGLKWLLDRGFEIGNHTYSHSDLSRLSKDKVQREIGRNEAMIVGLTGRHTTTLAYPFGSVPEKSSWAEKKDGEYAFHGIFLAGWRPSASPFATEFDAQAIMRVQSQGKIAENDCKRYCSAAWLDWLRDHPAERYVSDGDPGTIAFPAALAEQLEPRYRAYGRSY